METVRAYIEAPAVQSIIFVLFFAAMVALLVSLGKRIARQRINDLDTRYRTSKILSIFGYVVVFIVIVTQAAGKMSGVSVAIGAAGAGVAFALQEVIASFAGWLAVSFGGFYSVGDRVQLGGIKGDVIDQGFLRTTLMECGAWVNGDLYSGRIVRVANSFVFKEPVFNYSGEFPFLWDEITVPIKYGSDYDLARKIISMAAADIVGDYTGQAAARWQELIRKYRIEHASVEPLVTLVANDNWVEFTLRYVVDHRARRTTKDKIFSRILKDVDASGGRVGMASMTVHLVEAPRFDVRLSSVDEDARSGPLASDPPPPNVQ